MKRIIFAFAPLLLATPALAQQAASPGQRAWEIMYNREVAEHQGDLGAAVQLQDQVQALAKQVTDLTHERDALKEAAAIASKTIEAPPSLSDEDFAKCPPERRVVTSGSDGKVTKGCAPEGGPVVIGDGARIVQTPGKPAPATVGK